MKSIAIITARAGSKRIPKKNIKEFCGKPIIAYSIDAAIQSNVFDEVMVSTDSPEIADIAKKYGATVPFLRSEATSGDFATTNDVVKEVLDRYDEMGIKFEIISCIYPTAPFLEGSDLRSAYTKLIMNNTIDSVMPVVRYSFPPQRAMIIRDGCLIYQYPENALKRSQDLEPIYHDCGQFYMCRRAIIYAYSDLIGPHNVAIEISEERVQDIDNPSDWLIAESKYSLMRKKT